MAQTQIQGKSVIAIAKDVRDGYVYLSSLYFKKFDQDSFKNLHHILKKIQKELRSEKFPLNDIQRLRTRNQKLQRLHQAMMVVENAAKEKKIYLQ